MISRHFNIVYNNFHLSKQYRLYSLLTPPLHMCWNHFWYKREKNLATLRLKEEILDMAFQNQDKMQRQMKSDFNSKTYSSSTHKALGVQH